MTTNADIGFLLANHERALETLAWFMSGNRRASTVVITAAFIAGRGGRS